MTGQNDCNTLRTIPRGQLTVSNLSKILNTVTNRGAQYRHKTFLNLTPFSSANSSHSSQKLIYCHIKVPHRPWVRIRPGLSFTYTKWQFSKSKTLIQNCIFFAYLTCIRLMHHSIYHTQLIIKCFVDLKYYFKV